MRCRSDPQQKEHKSERVEQKSIDIFSNFRELLDDKEIIAYRKESGERFLLQEWGEDRAGFALVRRMSERLFSADAGLTAEYRLAKTIVLKEGFHRMIENTAKSLSLFPPKSTYNGADFQDLSQDFETICGKFYNYRQLESVQNLRSVQFEAMFISDFGDAYCGDKSPNKKSTEEQMMIEFIELADKYARSVNEVEDDTVKKLFRALQMDRLISQDGKDQLDKFWSDNQTQILAGAALIGALAIGLSYLSSKSRQGRSK